jgi:hypothetical protein
MITSSSVKFESEKFHHPARPIPVLHGLAVSVNPGETLAFSRSRLQQ